jgi:hypothetical protein
MESSNLIVVYLLMTSYPNFLSCEDKASFVVLNFLLNLPKDSPYFQGNIISYSKSVMEHLCTIGSNPKELIYF